MKALLFILTVTSLYGCTATQQKMDGCEIPELSGKSCVKPNYANISQHPLGISASNPIKADGPQGQRDYLKRLICPDGRAVKSFSRVGSVGISPYGFMMDLYDVKCKNKTYSVYIDMYHPDYIENIPVDGFTIKH